MLHIKGKSVTAVCMESKGYDRAPITFILQNEIYNRICSRYIFCIIVYHIIVIMRRRAEILLSFEFQLSKRTGIKAFLNIDLFWYIRKRCLRKQHTFTYPEIIIHFIAR